MEIDENKFACMIGPRKGTKTENMWKILKLSGTTKVIVHDGATSFLDYTSFFPVIEKEIIITEKETEQETEQEIEKEDLDQILN